MPVRSTQGHAPFACQLSAETHHGQRVNSSAGALPAGALDGHLGDRHRARDRLTATRRRCRLGHPGRRCRDRRPHRAVRCPHADGSSMHTMSGLCTPARKNLGVIAVIDTNGRYDIVRIEVQRVEPGPPPCPKALDLHDLSCPPMDFVTLDEGMGVPHVVSTAPKSSPTPAAAASSNPGRTSLTRRCPHRCARHRWAVHGHRHPRASGEHPHPRAGQVLPAACGGSRRPDGWDAGGPLPGSSGSWAPSRPLIRLQACGQIG